MTTLIFRAGLLLLHVFINVVIVAYLTRYDVSGSWIAVAGFAVAVFILLSLLIIHLMSFIKFYKRR